MCVGGLDLKFYPVLKFFGPVAVSDPKRVGKRVRVDLQIVAVETVTMVALDSVKRLTSVSFKINNCVSFKTGTICFSNLVTLIIHTTSIVYLLFLKALNEASDKVIFASQSLLQDSRSVQSSNFYHPHWGKARQCSCPNTKPAPFPINTKRMTVKSRSNPQLSG